MGPLKAGDKVVVGGVEKVRPGMKVESGTCVPPAPHLMPRLGADPAGQPQSSGRRERPEPGVESTEIEDRCRCRGGRANRLSIYSPSAQAASTTRSNARMSNFFIRRPIVAMVIAIIIVIVGLVRDGRPAHRTVSQYRSPTDPGRRRPTSAPTRSPLRPQWPPLSSSR